MTNPKADLEMLRTRAIEIQAMMDNMDQIVGLEYEDIVEEEEDVS